MAENIRDYISALASCECKAQQIFDKAWNDGETPTPPGSLPRLCTTLLTDILQDVGAARGFLERIEPDLDRHRAFEASKIEPAALAGIAPTLRAALDKAPDGNIRIETLRDGRSFAQPRDVAWDFVCRSIDKQDAEAPESESFERALLELGIYYGSFFSAIAEEAKTPETIRRKEADTIASLAALAAFVIRMTAGVLAGRSDREAAEQGASAPEGETAL